MAQYPDMDGCSSPSSFEMSGDETWASQMGGYTYDASSCQIMEPTSNMSEYMSFKKRDQKRRPKPKDGTMLLCQICGDRALGYNFDAITCESCKAFFRRNALKLKVFQCSFEGNCKLDPHTRKFCSGCRLKKCIDVGMKKEWILNDEQLAKRRKKCSTSEDQQLSMFNTTPIPPPIISAASTVSSSSSSPISSSAFVTSPTQKSEIYSPCSNSSEGDASASYISDSADTSSLGSPNLFPSLTLDCMKREVIDDDAPRPMPPEVAENIEILEKEYNMVFESGYSAHQAKKIVEKPSSANDLFNMTDIFIRRLIKFVKHINEFKSLRQEDQILLLKGGIMEIMVLRSAMGFDPDNHKWKVKQIQDLKEHGIDPSIIKEQLGSGMYMEHMKFVKTLHQLTGTNRTIMTLLFVIEIFSADRPNLINKTGVAAAQEKFTHWLRLYLESIMPISEAKALYPRLLMKLLDVRNLGESSSQLASTLDISKLEPLLIEVFSLQ